MDGEVTGCKNLIKTYEPLPSGRKDVYVEKALFICEIQESPNVKVLKCKNALDDFEIDEDNTESRKVVLDSCNNPKVTSQTAGPAGPIGYGPRRGFYETYNARPRLRVSRRRYRPQRFGQW